MSNFGILNIADELCFLNHNSCFLLPRNTTKNPRCLSMPRVVSVKYYFNRLRIERTAMLKLFLGRFSLSFEIFLIAFLISHATSGFCDDLNFSDFSNVSGLQINGDAAQVGNVLRVSNASVFTEGSFFSTSAIQLNDQNSFHTYFEFRIGQSGGIGDGDGSGADGLVFTIQPIANSVGGTGGGIGYNGIRSSIGIEFDTFHNGASFGDFNGNHVGLDIDGNIASVETVFEPIRFNNGSIWRAWIEYNGLTDLLEVRWSMTPVRPEQSMLSAFLDLESIIGQDSAFVGFTSATGSGYGNHDLLSWRFSGNLAIPEPSGGFLVSCLVPCFIFARRRRQR